jgi:hypothetical protein
VELPHGARTAVTGSHLGFTRANRPMRSGRADGRGWVGSVTGVEGGGRW